MSKGLTAVCAVLGLLLLIVGSSLAFSGGAGSAQPSLSGDKKDSIKDWKDFLENYYDSTSSGAAKVDIPRVDIRPRYSMELSDVNGEELTLAQLYSKCSPSIVGIRGYTEGVSGYKWGTGIVISGDGLIVTNTHIVEDCTSAEVCLSDDTECEAKLVGADAVSDIALLKIDAKGLAPAEFGRSDLIIVGEHVAAIGNPLGEEYRLTLTDGIISGIDRGVQSNGHSMTLLQTNTAINEGNSGGALFNMYGQVIGVTNMKIMSVYSSIEGIGFAIPSTTISSVCNALIKDGEVRGRPALGITVGMIPETVLSENDIPEGLYVSDVSENSDAEKKGVAVGDIITEINGSPVKTTDDVLKVKDALNVGDSMHITVWRDGAVLEFDVELYDTNDVYK